MTRPPRFRPGGWICDRFQWRAAQVTRAEDMRRELGSYPGGYSPATLLSARPDGPDPTGPLVNWAPQDWPPSYKPEAE